MIKDAIRALLGQSIGPHRLRRLRSFLRFGRGPFSEADLIWSHFARQPRQGVMIDVGAHFGESSEPYLEMKWQVLAFEPDAANRRKLVESLRLPGMQLFDSALGDVQREGVPFYASAESDGISGLSAFRESHRETQRVQLTTLAAILQAHPVPQVDFLKIDTEGHDLFVLRGFPWETYHPEVVLCEFEDRKTRPLGYNFRDMGDFLLARGYEVYLSEWRPIVRYGAQHRWRNWSSYPCGVADENAWGNFVACRPNTLQSVAADYLKPHLRVSKA